jgi:hypothetical protein
MLCSSGVDGIGVCCASCSRPSLQFKEIHSIRVDTELTLSNTVVTTDYVNPDLTFKNYTFRVYLDQYVSLESRRKQILAKLENRGKPFLYQLLKNE